MKKLHSLLKKLGFEKMPQGWGDAWTTSGYEVQISHKDYRGPASVYIERLGTPEAWRDLTLKAAFEKLRELMPR